MPKRLDRRTVAAALRRLHLRRRIHLVQEGRAVHGAVYTKGERVGGG